MALITIIIKLDFWTCSTKLTLGCQWLGDTSSDHVFSNESLEISNISLKTRVFAQKCIFFLCLDCIAVWALVNGQEEKGSIPAFYLRASFQLIPVDLSCDSYYLFADVLFFAYLIMFWPAPSLSRVALHSLFLTSVVFPSNRYNCLYIRRYFSSLLNCPYLTPFLSKSYSTQFKTLIDSGSC